MLTRLVDRFRYRKALLKIRSAGIWFVDIPRTSSSSIRTELSGHFGAAFGKSDLFDTEHNVNTQLIPSHLTAQEMMNRLGNSTWQELFTFSLVRNPWDRMLSLFRYRKKIGEIAPERSLEDYLELFFEPIENSESPYRYHGYYLPAIDYLSDRKGNIMVDYVGRFENRARDLEYISGMCQCSLGNLHLQAAENDISYREFYHESTMSMVSRIWKRDIEAFNYTF